MVGVGVIEGIWGLITGVFGVSVGTCSNLS